MPLRSIFNNLFKLALLVVLTIIAVRIWQDRTADTPHSLPRREGIVTSLTVQDQRRSSEPEQAHEFDTENGTVSDEHLINLMNTRRGFEIIDLINVKFSNFGHRGRIVSSYFEVAAEHGEFEDIEAIGNCNIHWRIQPAIFRKALQQLAERQKWKSIGFILSNEYKFHSNRSEAWTAFDELYAQQPLATETLAQFRLGLTEASSRDVWMHIFAIAFEGSDEQWSWAIHEFAKAIAVYPEQESTVNLFIFAQSYLAKPNGQARLKQLLGVLTKIDYNFARRYITLLGPELAPKLATGIRSVAPTPEITQYVLSLPKESIDLLVDTCPEYTAYIKQLWIAGWRDTETDLEPLLAWLRAIHKSGEFKSEWPGFNSLRGVPEDRLDWLWDHGFKPASNADRRIMVYMAVRNGDRQLLENALRDAKADRTLVRFLTYGESILRKNDGLTRPVNVCPLSEAASLGDLEAIRKILQIVTAREHKGPSPVLAATLANHQEAVKLLIGAGFSVNQKELDSMRVRASELSPALTDEIKESAPELNNSLAWKLAEQAAHAGDTEALRAAISQLVCWQQQYVGIEDRPYVYRSPSRAKESQAVVRAAIHSPECIKLLQFEGFHIYSDSVQKMIELGSEESLRVALKDYRCYKSCVRSAKTLSMLADGKPQILRVLQEFNLLK